MRLIWALIPLVLGISMIGVVGIQDVDARPMDRFWVTDIDGNSIDEVKIGEQIRFTRDAIIRDYSSEHYPIPPECEVKDLEVKCFNHTKQVLIIFQIKDEDGKVEQISWLKGELQPNIFETVGISWTPQKSGTYTVTSFIWTSLDNLITHARPTSVSIQITDAVDSTKFIDNLEKIPSPKTQFELGAKYHEIVCKENLNSYWIVPVGRSLTTICVTSETFKGLYEKGYVSRQLIPALLT